MSKTSITQIAAKIAADRVAMDMHTRRMLDLPPWSASQAEAALGAALVEAMDKVAEWDERMTRAFVSPCPMTVCLGVTESAEAQVAGHCAWGEER